MVTPVPVNLIRNVLKVLNINIIYTKHLYLFGLIYYYSGNDYDIF
jgi:hypothetical protein